MQEDVNYPFEQASKHWYRNCSLFMLLIMAHVIERRIQHLSALTPAFLFGHRLVRSRRWSIGLADVARRSSALVPWAWGVNGCASVLAATMAALLAIHAGLTVVVLAAIALYGLAATILVVERRRA